MVMAWAAGKVRLREMLRAWLIVYIGIFIGAIGTAILVFLSGQYLSGRGAVASVALKLALDKATEPFGHALFLGILCNVLVCLAVWLALGARTTSDKVLAVLSLCRPSWQPVLSKISLHPNVVDHEKSIIQ